MAKVYMSDIIPASASEVWSTVGDFAGIGKWHPAVTGSQLVGTTAGDQVGAVRECLLDGGAKLVERQTARSDGGLSYSYEITESPMPMKNYVGSITLHQVTETGQTFMEWRSTFDPDPGAEEELTNMMGQVYKAGFDSLKARFGGS